MNLIVFKLRGHNGELYRIESASCVAVRSARYMLERIVVYSYGVSAEAAFAVGKRRADALLYVVGGKRIELKKPASAYDSASHGHHRVFGS